METSVEPPNAKHSTSRQPFQNRRSRVPKVLAEPLASKEREDEWPSFPVAIAHFFIAGLMLALPFGVFATTVVWSTPAYAGGACTTQGNYHEGYASNSWPGWPGSEPHWVEGINAVMTDRSGYILCSGQNNGGNFSTAWVMMASNDLTGWDQAGTMYRFGNTCVTEWAQVRENNQDTPHDYYKPGACSSPGTTNTYWVQAFPVGSSYVYRSNVNTFVIHQTSWDPFVAWTAPFVTQVEAETTYPQSDIPGSSSLPYDYSNIAAQNYTDDSWADLCNNQNLGAVNGQDANFAEYAVHCDHIHTWTVNP